MDHARHTPQSVDQTLPQAVAAYQAGDLQQVEGWCREVLGVLPRHGQVRQLLGVLLVDVDQADEAITHLQVAVDTIEPSQPAVLSNLARAQLAAGQPLDAVVSCRRAIERSDVYVPAWNNLGVALLRTQQAEHAIPAFERVLTLQPQHHLARANLARAQRARGRPNAARSTYEAALAQSPDCELHIEFAELLMELGHMDEARSTLRRCVDAFPDSAAAHSASGWLAHVCGDLHAAESAYRRALALDAAHSAALRNLGAVCATTDRTAQALTLLSDALRADPDDATAQHLRAALTGETPTHPDPRYVTTLFDSYAARFDEHLDQLQYRVPERLRTLVGDHHSKKHSLKLLDLGCGTGRCGPLFRDVANHVTGVDLSARMLDIARDNGAYDQLLRDDVSSALSSHKNLDLILAADVFIYVGALDDVFALAARALAPGGVFAFSVESIDEPDYVLRPSGRYGHASDYISRLGRESGFERIVFEPHTVRREQAPVEGHLWLLRTTR